MKYKNLIGVLAVTGVCLSGAATAQDNATEARTMLERAVLALEADTAAALETFNSGEDGFRDGDLYVFCADPDGITTAHPWKLGNNLKEEQDATGKPFGAEIYQVAEEGSIGEVRYLMPKSDGAEPAEKVTLVTRVDDQTCGVGYYPD